MILNHIAMASSVGKLQYDCVFTNSAALTVLL